ncbi:hypothetical protein [Brenneria roseae]|nr:hypothetical protein [Brenneria roseae]
MSVLRGDNVGYCLTGMAAAAGNAFMPNQRHPILTLVAGDVLLPDA